MNAKTRTLKAYYIHGTVKPRPMSRKDLAYPLDVTTAKRIAGYSVWHGRATQELRATRPAYFLEIAEDLFQTALLDLYDVDRWAAVIEKYPDAPMNRVAFRVSGRAVGRMIHHERKGLYRQAVKEDDGYHNRKYADGTTRVSTWDNDHSPLYHASVPFRAFTFDDEYQAGMHVLNVARCSLKESDAQAVEDVIYHALNGTGKSFGYQEKRVRARIRPIIMDALKD